MISKKEIYDEFYKIVNENNDISYIFKKFIKLLIENGAVDLESNFDSDLKYLHIKFKWKQGKKKKNLIIDYGKWLGVHLTYY